MTKKSDELKKRGFPLKCPACRSARVEVTPENVFRCKRCGYANTSKSSQ